MKAIKIASGFAVTALAAAVSMQANAAAHGMSADVTTVATKGEINVRSIIDLENDERYNTIKDELDKDNDHFELTIETKVSHGPFSGKLVVEDIENTAITQDGYSDGEVAIFLDDLMVTEGPISFGMLGDVQKTDSLLDVVRDEDDGTGDLNYTVDAALRYTSEMGLTIQAEGEGFDEFKGNGQSDTDEPNFGAVGTHAFGIGALYTADVGVGSVYLEAQYSEDGSGTANDMFMGLGAELNPTEELSVTLAFQSVASDSIMGVRGTYATDALTAYAAYYEDNRNADDSDEIYVGASMSMGMLTPYVDYLITGAANGDTLEVGAKYKNGAIGGKAEVTLGDLDATTAADPEIELDVNYTSEAGVKYAAEYTFQDAAKNNIEFIAAYSF